MRLDQGIEDSPPDYEIIEPFLGIEIGALHQLHSNELHKISLLLAAAVQIVQFE